jgi:UDP-N-acetylglucosamine 2-epimerase (non-hydrolysing)
MSLNIKVFTVVGTRPDTIKLAPVLYELQSRSNITSILCSSGQHKEMLEQATDIFDLVPDINLQVMIPGQSLENLTSRMLTLLAMALDDASPDYVIVHGDTTTAFCASLAAFYKQIPVVHVEAGLRTHNILGPFPEEFNRQVIARIAHLNFAPTPKAVKNLLAEGVAPESIFMCGNTVVESLKIMSSKISQGGALASRVDRKLAELFDFDYRAVRTVLITMHRRENIGDGIQEVCIAIARLAATFADTKFIFPVHLNPSVSNDVHQILSGLENVHLVPPLPYAEFIAILSSVSLIITDSGGIQEESVSLGKHALVTRKATERDEGVDHGLLQIVDTDGDQIFESASRILEEAPDDAIPVNNPYGEGEVSKFIVNTLLEDSNNKFTVK